MAHPVTPSPDYWPAADAAPETYTEHEGWAGLPADLLFRVSGMLDSRDDLPCLLATCRSWHGSLKSALVSMRIHCLGDAALGVNFSSVQKLDASLRRRSAFGLTYLAPLGNAGTLSALFPSLVQLNLSGQDLGPHGLAVLQPLAVRLRHLDCSGCELGRGDMPALAKFSHLTTLALNAVRVVQAPQQGLYMMAEREVAGLLIAQVLPRLSQLRRLELCIRDELIPDPTGDAEIMLPPPPGLGGAQGLQWQLANAQRARMVRTGLTVLQRVAEVVSHLPNLSCLLLIRQHLSRNDLTALASMTSLTHLAFTWGSHAGTLEAWDTLVNGPVGHSLRVLDLDVHQLDEDERISLAPLTRLQALRLRRCNDPRLLLDLIRRQPRQHPAPGPGARAGGGRAAATSTPGGGGAAKGASGVGGGGVGGAGGGGGVHDGGGGGGLVRLELLEARSRITPALVAQVCSCLPDLRVLDISGSFCHNTRSRAHFQLAADLLVRDLAVLCPLLVQLGLKGVPLHGVGFPDGGRDLALLPFVSAETEPTAVAAAAGPSGSGAGGSASSSSAAGDLVQLPFPRLTSLVVKGGPMFMKSRFRSFANLRALRQLRIEGMTEKDFLATCKMGCYEPLSRLTNLTALHILASPPLPPPPPPQPAPAPGQPQQQQPQQPPGLLPGAAAAAPPQPPAAAADDDGAAAVANALAALEAALLQAAAQNPGPLPNLLAAGLLPPGPWLPGGLGGAAGAGGAAAGGGAAAAGVGGGGAAGGAGAAGGGGAGGGGGPALPAAVAAGRSASSQPRPEPHLNFVTQLATLRVLTLESLATRGRVFSYLAQLPHLRALSLGGCIALSEDGLAGLRLCCMPRLRSLRMMGCVWDDGDAWRLVSCLPGTTPSLEQLELGACPGVTAQRLAALLTSPHTQTQARTQQPTGTARSAALPSNSTSAAAASASAAGGSGNGPSGQLAPWGFGALPRLRYMRLYEAPVSPEDVLQHQAALAVGSLRFLDFVDPSPSGGDGASGDGASFSMVRSGEGFQLITPVVVVGAGGAKWRDGSAGSKYGSDVMGAGGAADWGGPAEWVAEGAAAVLDWAAVPLPE